MPNETTRRRPADRRALILRSAARSFSENGYHPVHLDDIAEVVGISTPALYRHFPNKYALFAETARMLADALAAAVAAVPATPEDPAAEVRALLAALTRTSIDNRRTGGLYHWEAAYLQGDDLRHVRDVVVAQHRRIRAGLRALRPDLDRTTSDILTAAMISVVASPATHRTALPGGQALDLIVDAATSLTELHLPAGQPQATPAGGLAPTSKREVLLAESIRLFAAKSFHEVTIEDIARAAGMPASGVYRHFSSKADILHAAFWRASDRVSAMITDALASASTPREAIVALVTGYANLCVTTTDMLSAYVSEIGSVAPAQRTRLRNQQRLTVEEWAGWVSRERPELGDAQARFLVQAVLNVTIDLIRQARPPSAAAIAAIGIRILLGPSDGVEAGK